MSLHANTRIFTVKESSSTQPQTWCIYITETKICEHNTSSFQNMYFGTYRILIYREACLFIITAIFVRTKVRSMRARFSHSAKPSRRPFVCFSDSPDSPQLSEGCVCKVHSRLNGPTLHHVVKHMSVSAVFKCVRVCACIIYVYK